MLKWNKTSYVWSINEIFLKDPLCMEYNIVQMSAEGSYGGTNPSGPIFNDSAA